MTAEILPVGTLVEARFSAPTGSRISRSGDQIAATVIAPVFSDGQLMIPQGAIVSGVVGTVERLGLGLKHLTATIEYRFDRLQFPDGDAIPIRARVAQVETARERVNARGTISGIYPTANASSGVAFYALPLLWIEPEVAVPVFAIKCVIARSPDPEIYFPAGTEVILQLSANADIPKSRTPPHLMASLSAAEMADAQRILAQLPQQRTNRGGNHPSDLINILFLGGREPINRAFHAAGWDIAQRRSLRSIFRMYHCMVQRTGYSAAPMGKLTLNGVKADLDYQKGLNTFSKRHHVRLWKQRQENAWLSAATEDIGYRIRRMHLTHATDPLIDNERAKVLNDLAFTGCLDAATLITRNSSDTANQQDRSLETDRKLAILRMNDCRQPKIIVNESMRFGSRGQARAVQALLALRNDLIRTNPVSLAYNTARALRQHQRSQRDGSTSAASSNEGTAISSESMRLRWIRSSVLDPTTNTNVPGP